MSEVGSGDGMTPKQVQAARIQTFLTRLAEDDGFLVRYVRDRVGVLREELDADRLTLEDFALLVGGNCCQVQELLGTSVVRPWIWIGGG